MAIEQSIWKTGDVPEKLQPAVLQSEDFLEQQIVKDMAILNDGWMLIGRQVRTDYDKRIDLLAIDAAGSLIVIELKRDKTPRDVVAQALEYAAWVVDLTDSDVAEIYANYAECQQLAEIDLMKAFALRFGSTLSAEEINASHQMVIVATRLDNTTERIISYLNDTAGVGVNVLFFNVFEDGGNQYLSRAWMIDPGESQEKAVATREQEPWNGEFYVSYGVDNSRSWGDALRYGFISAGGGRWYTQTLNMLSEGDRVWVNCPGGGYVGVGEVLGSVIKAVDFRVDGQTLAELETDTDYRAAYFIESDDDYAEYLVPVRWIKTVDAADAVSETGFFGNQNSVCKPRTPKWGHTVNRLKKVWGV
ncbi:MAG: DUF91 domain-containing protein [Porticoccaceae bacterium]|nr:DUF91 domain-containing protein [Porticoccaceae bacterium]